MNAVSQIAASLGLPDDGQDWGLEYADATRLEEFVLFAEAHSPANAWEPEALAELILESAEAALAQGLLSDPLRERTLRFFASRQHLFPIMWEHWQSTASSEWPFECLVVQQGRTSRSEPVPNFTPA